MFVSDVSDFLIRRQSQTGYFLCNGTSSIFWPKPPDSIAANG